MHSQMTGTHLRKCHRWDELAVVYDPRDGYDYGPAAAKAGMSAKGGGKDRAVTPEVGMTVVAVAAKL